MSSRSLRIGLLGQFGIGNLGNEASLEAMAQALRRRIPNAELICISDRVSEAGAALGLTTAPIRASLNQGWLTGLWDRLLLGFPSRLANIWHAFATMRRLDAVVVPGTGAFDDFGERPSGLPYDWLRWSYAAKLNGKPIAFVSVGAGPIRNKLSRAFMAAAARVAAYRSFRDTPSLHFMRAAGAAKEQDAVYPDLAFLLPAPGAPIVSETAPLTVAVGVMAYFGWSEQRDARIYQRYIETLSDYVIWLVQTGRRVRLVIGAASDKAAVGDVRARVLERAPEAEVGILPFEPAHDLHDLMVQLSGVDIAVVTRFHNVVAALRVGRPVISAGYAQKNATLLGDVGLGDFSCDVEECGLAWLQERTERLIAVRKEKEGGIRTRVAAYGEALDAQCDRLVDLLAGAR